jgi:hypothetical protein
MKSTDSQELADLPDWQRRILEERLADLERNPNDEQTWDEVKAELWPSS